MISNFEMIIGIEIHLELNTKTKMFSPMKNDFLAAPNTCVSAIDLGYPGTLPTVNKKAVISAIKLAKALHMEIDHELHFDRKNYFYSDLPKGYQITQQFRPIGKNGKIKLQIEGYEKVIEIERIHLEEDTARQQHLDDQTLINYNRAGIPLIEIVTKPNIRTKEEAIKYVDAIRQIASFLNISDAVMAKGSLRADINLSIRMLGTQEYGTKVEIKNLNSLNNIKKAIEYEYDLQVKKIINNEEIKQETKNFDEAKMANITLREKTDAIDYKYFPDPNIPVISLDPKWIDAIKIGELPEELKKRYLALGVSEEFCDQIINNFDYAQFIEAINYHDKVQVVKIFFSEILPLEKKYNKKISTININPQQIAEVLSLLEEGYISGKQLKQIIPLLINWQSSVLGLIEENGFKLISDENIINNWLNEIKNDNQNLFNNYTERPERTIKFIVGEIMRKSRAQANPVLTSKLITKMFGEENQ